MRQRQVLTQSLQALDRGARRNRRAIERKGASITEHPRIAVDAARDKHRAGTRALQMLSSVLGREHITRTNHGNLDSVGNLIDDRPIGLARIELRGTTTVHGDCGGTGAEKGSAVETCPDCHGSGQVTVQQRTPFGVMQTVRTCPHCGGKGKIIKNPCKKCGGKGRVKVSKTVTVNIPAGIDDGQTVAVRGQGDSGRNGGPAGDLRVTVSVRPDPLFERDGYDIWCEIPITFAQAAMGDDIVVPTVDGKVSYHVPEGTQSGTVFRLRDKGVPALNGRGRGDQYVIVDVEIPKKVTRAQREALKAFEDSMKEDNYEKRKGFFKNLRDRFS